MTKEEENSILDQIRLSLKEYAFGDIKKSREKEMLIASFILCFCFIGQLSAYRYFKDRIENNDFKKFKAFLKVYFNSAYEQHADELYVDLRSKLVHNYSANGKFSLSDDAKEWHLTNQKGKIFLNIDVFISDIEFALVKYLSDLDGDTSIRQIAIKHHKNWKILSANNLTISTYEG